MALLWHGEDFHAGGSWTVGTGSDGAALPQAGVVNPASLGTARLHGGKAAAKLVLAAPAASRFAELIHLPRCCNDCWDLN